jgi:predicted alpha/beta-hydrolase family hydrolase
MSASRTTASAAKELRLDTGRGGEVSALLLRPEGATALYVLAHGAGVGMRHPSLESIATRLAARSLATLRYQFPYMEKGSGRPDPKPVLHETVRRAVERASVEAGDLPLFAGGRSMGGRMTSEVAADGLGVKGLVFLAFPLHAPGKPGVERAAHLARVSVPMLFVQGTRDPLADLDLLRPVLEPLGPRATMLVVEGGDHSFHVPRRSGRTDEQALDEIVDGTAAWIGRVVRG